MLAFLWADPPRTCGVLHVLRALHVQMWGLWGHVVLF